MNMLPIHKYNYMRNGLFFVLKIVKYVDEWLKPNLEPHRKERISHLMQVTLWKRHQIVIAM